MSPPQNTNPKHTTSAHAVSGRYRNANLPQPLHLHSAVYVLSYESNAWPDRGLYNGILGVYTTCENAQRAGTRWLRERQPGHGHFSSDRFDHPSEKLFSEWKVQEKVGGEGSGWVKEGADIGLGFLVSRVARIKKCEVRADSCLPMTEEGKDGDGDGKEQEGEDEDEEEGAGKGEGGTGGS